MNEVKLSFEEILERLDSISKSLQSNGLPLEKAVDLYKEGISLSKEGEKQLNEAELRVAIVGETDEMKIFEAKLGQILHRFKIDIIDCQKSKEKNISTVVANFNIEVMDLFQGKEVGL